MPIAVGLIARWRQAGLPEAAPVGCQDGAASCKGVRKSVHHELVRRGHIHPAMHQHQRRQGGAGLAVPDLNVVVKPAYRDKLAAKGSVFFVHWTHIIRRHAFKHSQDSDKPDSQQSGGWPDPHAQMQRSFRWQVDGFFSITDVCRSRWARRFDAENAPERIAVCAHQPCAIALFNTFFERQQAADALSHVLQPDLIKNCLRRMSTPRRSNLSMYCP